MFSSPTLRTFVAEAEANHELLEWHAAAADETNAEADAEADVDADADAEEVEEEVSARDRWERRMLEETLRNIRESRRELEELGVTIRPIDDEAADLDGTEHSTCTNGEEKKTADESPPRSPSFNIFCRRKSQPSKKEEPPHDENDNDVGRRYIPIATIGTGTFSTVHLATHSITGCTVALKVMSKSRIAELGATEQLEREISNMWLCSGHPHIIKLYDVIDSPESMELVMEHVSGGELKDYVMAKASRVASPGGGEGLPPDEARQFFQQLIGGIEYMHSKGVIHRDLKMENLLLDSTKSRIKIVDFGLSKRVNLKQDEMLRTACGSPRHAAPEVMSATPHRPYHGPPVDVWSAGVILYAMLTAQLPFRGDDVQKDILPKVMRGEYWMPPFFTWGVRQLIQGMICVDVEERWTIGRIEEDEWFRRDFPDYLDRAPEEMEKEEERHSVDPKMVEEVVRRYEERGGSEVTSEMVELAVKEDLSGGEEMGAEEKDDIILRDLRVAYRLVLDEERNKEQSCTEGTEASSADGGCKDDDNMLFPPSCPCDDSNTLRVPWSRTIQ